MTYFSFLQLVKTEKRSVTCFCSLLWNFDDLFDTKIIFSPKHETAKPHFDVSDA